MQRLWREFGGPTANGECVGLQAQRAFMVRAYTAKLLAWNIAIVGTSG